MYTMVLMMAMGGSADVSEFGRNKGCNGSGGCTGVVASSSCKGDRGGFLGHRDRGGCKGSTTSCSGSMAVAYGCTGSSCHGGGSSCKGDRGGFLGLRNRGGNGCKGTTASCGCTGSLAGAGCFGGASTGCTGVIITGTGAGAVAMPPPPVTTGKEGTTTKE